MMQFKSFHWLSRQGKRSYTVSQVLYLSNAAKLKLAKCLVLNRFQVVILHSKATRCSVFLQCPRPISPQIRLKIVKKVGR